MYLDLWLLQIRAQFLTNFLYLRFPFTLQDHLVPMLIFQKTKISYPLLRERTGGVRNINFSGNFTYHLTIATGKSCILPEFYSIQYKKWLLGCF